jgi:predicted RNA-binding protein associated with RNAse of E/G family
MLDELLEILIKSQEEIIVYDSDDLFCPYAYNDGLLTKLAKIKPIEILDRQKVQDINNRIRENSDSIGELDENEIKNIIHMYIRGERTSNGAVAGIIRNGVLLALITRLKDLSF